MNDAECFLRKFQFNPRKRLWFAADRDHFLADQSGRIVMGSKAYQFLGRALTHGRTWTNGYASAQVKDYTPAAELPFLLANLKMNNELGKQIAAEIGCELSPLEVAPGDVPLRVFPYKETFQAAGAVFQNGGLKAALRIAGTRIRINASSMEDAIRIHNAFVPHVGELAKLGDHSNGERLRIYREMTKHPDPVIIESPEHLYCLAKEQGFDENPDRALHYVRILTRGQVELRMFGRGFEPEEVFCWSNKAREIIASAI